MVTEYIQIDLTWPLLAGLMSGDGFGLKCPILIGISVNVVELMLMVCGV